MLNILSFDCGYDPLAACIVSINTHYKKCLTNIADDITQSKIELNKKLIRATHTSQCELILQFVTKWIDILDKTTNQAIIVQKIIVANLLGDNKLKGLNDTNKIARIKFQLLHIDKYISHHDLEIDVVLCEDQKIPNKHVQSVKSVILGHYIIPINAVGDCNTVISINPRLKNKICFGNLSHKSFTDKYSSYTANKKHCAENMLFFLKVFDCEHLLDDIKHYRRSKQSKYYRDIGDAFCQCLMWYKYNFPIE